jgi:hypothetical protein
MMHSLRKLFSAERPKQYVRRWQRLVMSEPARVTLRSGRSRQVMLTQLGGGGARIVTTERLRPGDIVRLEFKIGIAEQHQHMAIVAHAAKDERGFQWMCGLSFLNLSAQGDPQLVEFIEEERKRRQIGFAVPRA